MAKQICTSITLTQLQRTSPIWCYFVLTDRSDLGTLSYHHTNCELLANPECDRRRYLAPFPGFHHFHSLHETYLAFTRRHARKEIYPSPSSTDEPLLEMLQLPMPLVCHRYALNPVFETFKGNFISAVSKRVKSSSLQTQYSKPYTSANVAE